MPVASLRGPFSGHNEEVDASFLGLNQAKLAINCVFDNGTIKKRGGWIERALFTDPGDGPILGIYDYVRNDGTRLTLVKSGSNLYAVTVAGGTWEKVKLNSTFSLSLTNLASFITVNNRVYFCDGTVLKVTDGIAVYDVQIARPGSAPAIVLSGAIDSGPLTGEYHYVFTYFSSLWGQESQSSNGSGALTPDGQSIQLTMDNSLDDRMTVGGKLRVYRRKISANEQFFYLVAQIDQAGGATTVYVDSLLDNDATVSTVAPPTAAELPQDVSFMSLQGGVAFFGGSAASPQTVFYTRSTSENPFTLMGSINVGSTGDSERVMGLSAYRSLTVVFKEASVWLLTGDSRDTFYTQRVIPNVGCRGHHTIVYAEGLLYFLAHDGFRWFDGARTERLSDPIKRSIGERVKDLDRLASGALFSDLGMILWTYAGAGASSIDSAAAYFFRNSERVGEHSWSPWRFQETPPTYLSVTRDAATGVPQFVFGFASGALGVYTDTTAGDDGQPIQFIYRTGKIALGRNDLKKLWRRLSFQCVPAAGGNLLEFHVLRDDLETGVTLFSHDMSDANVERRIGARSRELSIELFNQSVAPVEVVWLAVEGEILEARA